MISFVNALIWGGSEDEFEIAWNGAVFCDIEIKFIIAASAGMMTATAAISRNLARVMEQVGPAHKTKAMRRVELIQDLLICFGPPIWLMSAHYIVQPNRYYIVRYVGCRVIYLLRRYQRQYSENVNSTLSDSTKSRFMRLFVISTFMVSINFPIVLYIFYHNLQYPMVPYSWKLVHSTFGWDYVPYVKGTSIQFDHWIPVLAGIVCFIFFGTGREASQICKEWFEFFGLGAQFTLLKKMAPKKAEGSSSMSSWISGKMFSSASSRVTNSTTDSNASRNRDSFSYPEMTSVITAEPTHIGSTASVGIVKRHNQEGIWVERGLNVIIEDDGRIF
ncbi:uncharacterized protein LAJ45_07898 [Morchella importuna]|uniref:uncharacterized protein n=1 Tax=Morchella importuna TaxID=1174673 RepID=UPI001E8D601C|nr:uncharacterized protein LAJ45_07898 [Morchella importuna]KAH8148134.1 hypothetical protein LAJ45_07898 [Morchella importuna]